MNVFDDDWKTLGTTGEYGDWSGMVSEGLMLYQAFTDQQYSKDKKISCVSWHPTIYGKTCNIGQGIFSDERKYNWNLPSIFLPLCG